MQKWLPSLADLSRRHRAEFHFAWMKVPPTSDFNNHCQVLCERARREERQQVAEKCSTGKCRWDDAHGVEENISETRHAQIRFARGNSAERVYPVRPRDPGTMLTRTCTKDVPSGWAEPRAWPVILGGLIWGSSS